MTTILNLCGHGILRVGEPAKIFTVPGSTEIRFYTEHDKLYDNVYEPYVRQGGKINVQLGNIVRVRITGPGSYRQVPGRLQGRFKLYKEEFLRAGVRCLNYRLGFGFKLKYCFLENGPGNLALNEWKRGRNHLALQPGKEYDLYANTPGLQVQLAELMKAVKVNDKLIVRWFACREVVQRKDSRWRISLQNRQQVLTGDERTRPTFKALEEMLEGLEREFGVRRVVSKKEECPKCHSMISSRMIKLHTRVCSGRRS